jgi:single-strand DNA-binding protein
MSQITLQGNLVADPVQRSTASGQTVTKFRIASSGRRFDQTRNDWVNTDPVFMSVSCWRRLGTNVMGCLQKGDTVVVQGRLTYREYDDAKGAHRQVYEIDAHSVAPDLARYPVRLERPQRDVDYVPTQPTAPAEAVDMAAADPATRVPPTNPWTEPQREEPAA